MWTCAVQGAILCWCNLWPRLVVISNALPVLWMTSYLLISQFARRRRPAEAQCTRSLGLGYKLCAVIPAAGQRRHGTTFRALKITSQVAAAGAVSAVYDCLVVDLQCVSSSRRKRCFCSLPMFGLASTNSLSAPAWSTSSYSGTTLMFRRDWFRQFSTHGSGYIPRVAGQLAATLDKRSR